MATRDFRKLALLCGEASEGEETNEETQRQRYVYERQGYPKEKGWIEVGPQSDWCGKQHVALMVDNKEQA
jgi:hypothetical protein